MSPRHHPQSGSWVGTLWLQMVGEQKRWEFPVEGPPLQKSLYLLILPFSRDKIRFKVGWGNKKVIILRFPTPLHHLFKFSSRVSPELSRNRSDLRRWGCLSWCLSVHQGLTVVSSPASDADCLAGIPAPLLTSCGTDPTLLHPLCLSFHFCQKGGIAALFTAAKRRKQPTRPSADAWMNRMGSLHRVEYYLPLEGREF